MRVLLHDGNPTFSIEITNSQQSAFESITDKLILTFYFQDIESALSTTFQINGYSSSVDRRRS